MSSSIVYDALKARLVTELGATYPIRDWEEIEVQLQQATAPWIAIEDGGGNTELNSIGSPNSNWTTDDGYIDVHIFVPSTGPLASARSVATQVRDVLQYHRYTVAEGTMRSLTIEPPTTGFIQDGLWHSMSVTCNYSHQYAMATLP